MSTTTLTREFRVNGTLTAATSMTAVVTRTDTSATVANTGANPSTGVYTFTVTDPAYDLTYTFAITTVYNSVSYSDSVSVTGTTSTSASTGGAAIRLAVNSRLNVSLATNAANSYITEALRLIGSQAKWPDLHKTDTTTLAFTVGLKSKALPADFRIEDRLFRLNDSTLSESDPDTVRAYQEVANAARGEPLYYAIIGGSVYLWPIPDASYTIKLDYWYEPATISDETAALVLGDEFKEAVILGTMIQYMKGIGFGTHPKMAETEGLFMAEIAKLLPLEDFKPVIAAPFRYA